jgi:hypothetical protein
LVNTWKVILATLVIFAAGVVTGGLLVSHAERARIKMHRSSTRAPVLRPPEPRPGPAVRPEEAGRPPGATGYLPRGLRTDFLERLDREVHLTPEQRERIEKILAEGQERNRQIWERIQPELRREMQQTHDRIRAELNPEQRQRFEELMKQRPSRKGDEPFAPRRSPREPTDPSGSRSDAAPPPSPRR